MSSCHTGTMGHFCLWLRLGEVRPGEAWGKGQVSRFLPALVLQANACVYKDWPVWVLSSKLHYEGTKGQRF